MLQHIATEEGRIRPDGSGGVLYDYLLRDHLGNTRMMLADNGIVLEETHYYPFGLIQKGVSYQNLGVAANKEKFNGIEQTDELGLNQYDAVFRTMDPQLGRFWQIDPRPSDWESPYAAMRNDPVYFSDPLGDTTINGQYYENNVNGGTLEMVTVSNAGNGSSTTTTTSTSSGGANLAFAGAGAFATGTGILEGIGTGASVGAGAVVLPVVLVTAILLNYADAHPVYMPAMPIGFSPSDNTYFRPPNIIPPPPIPYRLSSEDNKQESDGAAKKPTPRTKSSKQLREEWEEATGQPWPKEPDNPNKNQHAHHPEPLADGGYDGYPNITPKPAKDHIGDHIKNGDFKRWGNRRNK